MVEFHENARVLEKGRWIWPGFEAIEDVGIGILDGDLDEEACESEEEESDRFVEERGRDGEEDARDVEDNYDPFAIQ